MVNKKLGILALGFLGMLYQKLFTSGGWFDWSQVLELHHEHLILLCFVIAIMCLLGGRRL